MGGSEYAMHLKNHWCGGIVSLPMLVLTARFFCVLPSSDYLKYHVRRYCMFSHIIEFLSFLQGLPVKELPLWQCSLEISCLVRQYAEYSYQTVAARCSEFIFIVEILSKKSDRVFWVGWNFAWVVSEVWNKVCNILTFSK